MEHTLGGLVGMLLPLFSIGLNPCFSGTYSRRPETIRLQVQVRVLILVLVEHTLGGKTYVGERYSP